MKRRRIRTYVFVVVLLSLVTLFALQAARYISHDGSFHRAIDRGDRISVLIMVALGHDVNEVVSPTLELLPLEMAIENRDVGMAATLIAAGADLNVKDKSGRTPLSRATGQPEMMELLIRLGAIPNLFTFVALNDADRLREALERNPAQREEKLAGLARSAASQNRLESMKVLIDYGVELDNDGEDDENSNSGAIPAIFGDRSRLEIAVQNNHFEMAEFLIEHGATPSLRNLVYMNKTAPLREALEADPSALDITYERQKLIHYAARHGCVESMNVLLDFGADINELDVSHETPYAIAERYKHNEMVEFLEERGGKRSLPRLVSSNAADALRKELEKDPSQIDTVYNKSKLIHIAAGARRLEAMKVLLEFGADINEPTDYGMTPMEIVQGGFGRNKEEMIEWLLDHGATPGVRDLIELDEADHLRNALETNPRLLDKPYNYEKLIHNAARLGRVESMRVLLELGADIDDPDNVFRTPYDVAQEYNQFAMVEFLRKRGAKRSLPALVWSNEVQALRRELERNSSGGFKVEVQHRPCRRCALGFGNRAAFGVYC